jgi:hypothetical protein
MIRIGKLVNYYGGIWVKKGEGDEIGRCFMGLDVMGLDDYDGIRWEEISLTLYHHLLLHNKKQIPPSK